MEIFLALLGHLFTARLDDVVQQHQRFVHMAPVFAIVIQSFPDHLHDLCEGHYIVGQISNFWHKCTWRPPGVIGRCFSNLDLGIWIVFHHILKGSANGRHFGFLHKVQHHTTTPHLLSPNSSHHNIVPGEQLIFQSFVAAETEISLSSSLYWNWTAEAQNSPWAWCLIV